MSTPPRHGTMANSAPKSHDLTGRPRPPPLPPHSTDLVARRGDNANAPANLNRTADLMGGEPGDGTVENSTDAADSTVGNDDTTRASRPLGLGDRHGTPFTKADDKALVEAVRVYVKAQYAVFSKYDHDKNLQLDKEEYRTLRKAHHAKKKNTLRVDDTALTKRIDQEFDRIDVNGNNSISFKEFIEHLHLEKWKAILNFPREGRPPEQKYEQFVKHHEQLKQSAYREDPKGYRDFYKGLPIFARYPIAESEESDFADKFAKKNKSANELWAEYEKEKKDHIPRVRQSVEKKKSLFARVKRYAEGQETEKEEAWAQALLAEMYEIGFGTHDLREKPDEAVAWYKRASMKEVAWAMEKLDENSALEVEAKLGKNRKELGDAGRQRALGVMYRATIRNILSEDKYEVEYEDKEITRTEALAREDLEPRVAEEKLRFIATGFDDWWNSLSILGLASEQSAAKPESGGGAGAADYFDYHTLDFRIIGAAHRAEAAEHEAELARTRNYPSTKGAQQKTVEEENGLAADAAFWRYALETRRVEKFYRRAFVCSTPELRKGDHVEYRTEKSSRWVKGTLTGVPKDESIRFGSSSYFGRSSKSSFLGRSSRRWGSSAPSGRATPTTSRGKFTVKHRYLEERPASKHKGEEVPRKYIRRDLGFIAYKIPRSHMMVDRNEGILQYALHWLRGIICCANVGQPRVVTVQTGIGGEGQDQQKAILLYRPDADPSKYQKVAKRIPVSRVTSIRLGNSHRYGSRRLEQKKKGAKETGMPNTPVFDTFQALNHHIPPEYCFSILTDAAETGHKSSPETISILMRGACYDEHPVTGTYRKVGDGREYMRVHASPGSSGEDCHIVQQRTSRCCFSPTFEWYIKKVDNTDLHRTKSTGRNTLVGSTWETRQSSLWEKCIKRCCPDGREPVCKPHWELNDDLVVREGDLVVPHALLLTSTSKASRKQATTSKWFLEFKNEAATTWGGSYLRRMKEDDNFSWADLPVARDDDDTRVDWDQIQNTAVDASIDDVLDARDGGGLDWKGVYVIDPRDRKSGFRYGYPRYVRIERDWEKGSDGNGINICPHLDHGVVVDKLADSSVRYFLQRERNGQWFLRSSKTLLHVRRIVKDGQSDGSHKVTVQPIFNGGNQHEGRTVELATGTGAFLNGAANEGDVQKLKVKINGSSEIESKPADMSNKHTDIEGTGWRYFIEDSSHTIKLQVSVSRVILYSRARHEPSEHGNGGASNPFFNSHRSGMFWTYHSLFENEKCDDPACSGHHAHDVVIRPLPQKVEIEHNSDPDAPRKTYELVHDIFTGDATCFVRDGLPLYRSRYDKGPDNQAEKLVCRIKPADPDMAEDKMHRSFTTRVSVLNDLLFESMLPTEWKKQKNSLRETLDMYIKPCGVCDFCIRQKQYCGGRGEAWRETESKDSFCKHAKSERDDLAAALSRFILDSKSTKGEGIEGLGTVQSASGSDDTKWYSEFGQSNRSTLGGSSRFGRSNSSVRGARSGSQQRMGSGSSLAAPVEERKEGGPGSEGGQQWFRHEDQYGDTFDV